jgi:DNA-binding XRE family transcriptional regulator
MYTIISDEELAHFGGDRLLEKQKQIPRYSEFAQRFRAMCNKYQPTMSQKELAKWLDVKAPTVNDWWNGKKRPGMESAIKISFKFNCPVDWLLTGRTYH